MSEKEKNKEEKSIEELKVEDASSDFEAGNLNKYDCLKLKEKNLIIKEYETEYVDPIDDEVKHIKDHPHVDHEDLKKR